MIKYKLTDEEKAWFGNRMDENRSGRVLVPTRLYKKFRKISGEEHLTNFEIKDYLIEHCY